MLRSESWTDGSKTKKKNVEGSKNEINHTATDRSQCINIDHKWFQKKEGTEREFQSRKQNRAEPCNNARSDESCLFEVVSEDDAEARKDVR